MIEKLIKFLEKIKNFFDNLFKGQTLVILLYVVIIFVIFLLIWVFNSYSGSIECVRTDGKKLYYEYNLNGIVEIRLNDVIVNESVVKSYEDILGTGFSLKPYANLKLIQKYEGTSTCKQ